MTPEQEKALAEAKRIRALLATHDIKLVSLDWMVDCIDELRADLERVTKERDALSAQLHEARAQVLQVKRERGALQRFKQYVHKRLDDAGVPHDPDPEHNAKHGCRIEGRLNVVLASSAECERLRWALRQYMHCTHVTPACFCTKEALAALSGAPASATGPADSEWKAAQAPVPPRESAATTSAGSAPEAPETKVEEGPGIPSDELRLMASYLVWALADVMQSLPPDAPLNDGRAWHASAAAFRALVVAQNMRDGRREPAFSLELMRRCVESAATPPPATPPPEATGQRTFTEAEVLAALKEAGYGCEKPLTCEARCVTYRVVRALGLTPGGG